MMHPFTPKAALRMPLVALIFAIALIAAGCGGGNSSAPTAFVVTGTVVDSNTGAPDAGYAVQIDGNTAETAITNSSGVFSIDVLPANLFTNGATTSHTLAFYTGGTVSTQDFAQSQTITVTRSEASANGVSLGTFSVGPPASGSEPAVRAG